MDKQSWSWYTRVPSKTNPADDPSRGVLVPSSSNLFAKVVDMPKLDPVCVLTSEKFFSAGNGLKLLVAFSTSSRRQGRLST